MYDKAYEDYRKKCKELGVKPSSKKEIFGQEIEQKKSEARVSITELSLARKQKAPALSETAKKAIEVQTNRRKKTAKLPKVKKETPQKSMKEDRPKRVLLSEDEKTKRARAVANNYYKNNKEVVLKRQREKRKAASTKVILSEEEKIAKRREASRLHHLKMKDDPEYQERRLKNAKAWREKNKDKIAASNKKYRDEVRTPEQLEEKRRKAREYRKKNLEHMRQKDRDRKEQRKEYIKNNPEAHERKKARERERYAKSIADPVKREKLREKWRKANERKRETS